MRTAAASFTTPASRFAEHAIPPRRPYRSKMMKRRSACSPPPKLANTSGCRVSKTNLILAELGWIERYVKGWVPTERGNALGANIREMRNGTPFVVWPASILDNAALKSSVAEQGGSAPADAKPKASAKADPAKDDFRSKFPCTHRTQDGHVVRSRAEVLIDNWLYVQGIVHAYERRPADRGGLLLRLLHSQRQRWRVHRILGPRRKTPSTATARR